MKVNFTTILMASFLFATTNPSIAQEVMLMGGKTTPTKSVYMSTGMDGNILSSAFMKKSPDTEGKFTTPRYTAFLQMGITANFDFNKNVGVFSGLNIKNIGFIEKYSVLDSTVIRRTYTFGIPLGLKIGKVDYGNYVLLGGGLDFPFNYKEKGFVKRNKKEKFNEWFSERTPTVLPYAFIGAHLKPGITFKLQYYPTNFLNSDFEETQNNMVVKPYQDYQVNLCLLTLGLDINYYPHKMGKSHKMVKK